MDAYNHSIKHRKIHVCICGEQILENQCRIECDNCKNSIHMLPCAGIQDFGAEDIESFYCFFCQQMNLGLRSVYKEVTNDFRHDRTDPNADGKPVQSGTPKFLSDLVNRRFENALDHKNIVKVMNEKALTEAKLLSDGFEVPILVDSNSKCQKSLKMKIPSNFTHIDMLNYFDHDSPLEVIDVRHQTTIIMNVKDFVNQMNVDFNNRIKIYNLISLEISDTLLSDSVRPPKIVTNLSWLDKYWPTIETKPKVSKFCLISMMNSYTDFHIDFGGTSVWYHLVYGQKVFYIIKPTKENLEAYEKWTSSDFPTDTFFAEKIGTNECYRLILDAGKTLFLPTGYIHAVHTLEDSLAFGGNFLHSLNIELQLKIREMEIRMNTPTNFQFPSYEMIHWYMAANINRILNEILNKPNKNKNRNKRKRKQKKKLPKYLVDGVKVLIPQLKKWLEESKEFEKKNQSEISNLVPNDYDCSIIIRNLEQIIEDAVGKLKREPIIDKKRKENHENFDLVVNEQFVSSFPIIGMDCGDSLNLLADVNQFQAKINSDFDGQMVNDQTCGAAQEKSSLKNKPNDSESKNSHNWKILIPVTKEILGNNQSDSQSDANPYDSEETESFADSLKNTGEIQKPELSDNMPLLLDLDIDFSDWFPKTKIRKSIRESATILFTETGSRFIQVD